MKLDPRCLDISTLAEVLLKTEYLDSFISSYLFKISILS
ncbi:hypothetical protein Bateq7PJ16_2101 [Bacillus subtilis]|nr:hypothetical protein Bateq7PJ16_2101 [Bacillus subtilis]